MGFVILRILLILACAGLGYGSVPFGVGRTNAVGLGLVVAAAVIAIEVKFRRLPSNILLGGLVGGAMGLSLGVGFSAAMRRMSLSSEALGWLQVISFIVFVYLGTVVGSRKGEWLTARGMRSLLSDHEADQRFKILDTSVIIDGRIAELCATGFIEGTLVVPQFVLSELQEIADSADALKRNRGRRGLDILQRLQKNPDVPVQISETEFPHVHEVDLKLIELAKEIDARIVTNDTNLSKVAQLRGVLALNVNELANAVKPVVLPGEAMSVYLLKSGKESGQAVGYLDDGTMVVVDSAGHLIGKTVNIEVTSVLQTTAGKMIFGKQVASATPRQAQVGS